MVSFIVFSLFSTVCAIGHRSVFFSKEGDTVIMSCTFPNIIEGDINYKIHWLKRSQNDRTELLDAKKECTAPHCKYKINTVNETTVNLVIYNAQRNDSGEYYCSENMGSYLKFPDKGVVLVVGDDPKMKGKVSLFVSQYGSSDHVTLICLVTEISTPYMSLRWFINGNLQSVHTPGSGLEVQSENASKLKVMSSLAVSTEVWHTGTMCACQVQLALNTSRHSSINRKGSCFGKFAVFAAVALGILLLVWFASFILTDCREMAGNCGQRREEFSTSDSKENHDTVTYAEVDFGPHRKNDKKVNKQE
ncbi:M1-specific T cell receptor beta chain-like [Erpetoichthys calabaricus]|uniref:M1-specific T cell receptor beta chain-like n=1 Tax=Erpetoichthys calabaricus TaxID=27687 RepID=UPI002234A792|nr:M1-specific T cell receptor beta chain-like [Erpetoichthys calabaricus]